MGIHANCAFSGFIDGREYVLHGDYDGYVFRQEVGNTFNKTNITAIYTTPYLDFGDTEIRKLLRTLNTFIRAEGSVSFNIAVRFDWGDKYVLNPLILLIRQSQDQLFMELEFPTMMALFMAVFLEMY